MIEASMSYTGRILQYPTVLNKYMLSRNFSGENCFISNRELRGILGVGNEAGSKVDRLVERLKSEDMLAADPENDDSVTPHGMGGIFLKAIKAEFSNDCGPRKDFVYDCVMLPMPDKGYVFLELEKNSPMSVVMEKAKTAEKVAKAKAARFEDDLKSLIDLVMGLYSS